VYGNALGGVGVGGTSNNIGVLANGTVIGVDAVTGTNGTGVRSIVDGNTSFAVAAGATSGGTGLSVASDTGTGVIASGFFAVSAWGNVGGIGVYATVNGDDATNIAVSGTVENHGFGVSGSAGAGYGVYGNATTGVGVGGDAASGGTAVRGHTTGLGYGVYGVVDGAGIGVYGTCGAGGNAARFDGTVIINGTFSVNGTKNFRIDHPLDPDNKMLVHACIESDQMLNVYAGAAILDADGRATVTLPHWFDALNAQPLVQLTGVGAEPAYIARTVRGGAFVIGGRPGQEVHWQVTGVRQDAWALEHPMEVEVDKSDLDRDTAGAFTRS
jgi:hypothetical protein